MEYYGDYVNSVELKCKLNEEIKNCVELKCKINNAVIQYNL